MIAVTKQDAVLENAIMLVPPLPEWNSALVALIGDAAHGLSPHIAGGSRASRTPVCCAAGPDTATAFAGYARSRSAGPGAFRGGSKGLRSRYAEFSHWMPSNVPSA